jgi:hypothetical protein
MVSNFFAGFEPRKGWCKLDLDSMHSKFLHSSSIKIVWDRMERDSMVGL